MHRHEQLDITDMERTVPFVPSPAPRPVTRSRVLLVEDDPSFAAFLSWVLAEHGYEVEAVATAPGALAALEESRYAEPVDIVVSDIHVPKGSGADLLWSPAVTTRKTPVILMTAFASRETRTFAESFGVDLLEKPFPTSALLERVFERLRERFVPEAPPSHVLGDRS